MHRLAAVKRAMLFVSLRVIEATSKRSIAMSLKRYLTSGLLAGAVALAMSGSANAEGLFTITSSSFKDGQLLAKKNAGANKQNPNCVGDNVSPPLSWSNPPPGTVSYALIMVDPEGRGGLGVDHWVAYGIPVAVTGFAENEVGKPSEKYVGGIGTAKQTHYMGPCTPPNQTPHHYTFTLIATDLDAKALPPGLTKQELFAKLEGHVKGATGIIGLFKNPI
jgi:Raf kinase inhibitor-like YbhB/YbcL family protein